MSQKKSSIEKVIMIPARAGSKRIKKKNIRLLSGKPLISYAIKASLETGLKVYVNSDCEVILKLAADMGCIPYRRDDSLCTDFSTNDEFMNDFIDNIKSEYVLQILPTSPFITRDEILNFSKEMNNFDTLISVKDAQIGCVYNSNPVNFDKTKQNPPSQEIEPVKIYATSLMGWKCSTFKDNMSMFGCAYHGGSKNTGYFTLTGWSTVDIDNESDFMIAESIAQMIPFEKLYKPSYH